MVAETVLELPVAAGRNAQRHQYGSTSRGPVPMHHKRLMPLEKMVPVKLQYSGVASLGLLTACCLGRHPSPAGRAMDR